MKSKLQFVVYAWRDGADFDARKAPDFSCLVTTETMTQAEEIGERKARKAIGTCDVIIAQPNEGARHPAR